MKEVPLTVAPRRFSLPARLKSFGYAFEGIALMLKTQHNAWVHLIATTLVTGLAVWYRVNASDWRWLIGAVAMVWMAEAMNTAVESLCDVVSPQYSLAVKCAKDVAAGSVLIAACAAAAIGVITFWPYFLETAYKFQSMTLAVELARVGP
ncbi:diacylglycerol kinase family protein [Polaromonas sp.]|uniref:diacylglycerol kinase family protein n=1 Tax=Polaromonas sp. TaxID=1869339 RepID=UPI003266A65F